MRYIVIDEVSTLAIEDFGQYIEIEVKESDGEKVVLKISESCLAELNELLEIYYERRLGR